MNTPAVAHKTGKQVARPLRVLVPLIKDDLQQGDEAAERAAMPYYEAAGEKLIEARAQSNATEFWDWARRNFGRSEKQCRLYMHLAEATEGRKNGTMAPSLREFQRERGENRPTPVHPQPWHEPVKKIIKDVDIELLNRRASELKRAEEREAQRELALQLIDIGYKALATKLHPDKGGSRQAMARLNQVRDRLKSCA